MLAWIIDGEVPRCDACNTPKIAGTSGCRQCGASPSSCAVLSYAGCEQCRPEAKLSEKYAAGACGGATKIGPATATLARSAAQFSTITSVKNGNAGKPCQSGALSVHASKSALDVVEHPVFHIVEVPGGIEHMVDVECPSEEYYEALAQDMRERHPQAQPYGTPCTLRTVFGHKYCRRVQFWL